MRHELVSSVVTVKLSPLLVHRAPLLWHIKYLPFFPPLDLKCTRIKLLRLGGEGAEGRRHFSYFVIKKNTYKPPPTLPNTTGKPKESLKYSLQNENKPSPNQDDNKPEQTVLTASFHYKF